MSLVFLHFLLFPCFLLLVDPNLEELIPEKKETRVSPRSTWSLEDFPLTLKNSIGSIELFSSKTEFSLLFLPSDVEGPSLKMVVELLLTEKGMFNWPFLISFRVSLVSSSWIERRASWRYSSKRKWLAPATTSSLLTCSSSPLSNWLDFFVVLVSSSCSMQQSDKHNNEIETQGISYNLLLETPELIGQRTLWPFGLDFCFNVVVFGLQSERRREKRLLGLWAAVDEVAFEWKTHLWL